MYLSLFDFRIATVDAFGTGGGQERANLLVLRDGGPFEGGIKGGEAASGTSYKKGLEPTHFVLAGGMQESVMHDMIKGTGECSLNANTVRCRASRQIYTGLGV